MIKGSVMSKFIVNVNKYLTAKKIKAYISLKSGVRRINYQEY